MITGKFVSIALLCSVLLLASCHSEQADKLMLEHHVHRLINAKNAEEEQIILSELLKSVRNTDLNYGYRVFNITKNRRVMPAELVEQLEDEFLVTIFLGDEPPYNEFKWKPRDNNHITRLIVP